MTRSDQTHTEESKYMPINDLFVKVEFKGNRREIFLNEAQNDFQTGDYAVVETENGLDLGTIRTRGCADCDSTTKSTVKHHG
ncbi:MAG: hypothetical protein COY19_07885, partial [Candidatus Marinimicrobia bacterium CG_4_10_14_0_2_um_filter_48_9]